MRLEATNDMIWSVWDRAATDAKDMYEVAEVYMSCMSNIRTCLMFERNAAVTNVYGYWPSIGTWRKEKLQNFRRNIQAKIEARESDMQELQMLLVAKEKQDGTEGVEGVEGKQCRELERINGMREETSRLGIMEHMAGMVIELIEERMVEINKKEEEE